MLFAKITNERFSGTLRYRWQTDTQIRDALETIKDIKTSLRTKGVSL